MLMLTCTGSVWCLRIRLGSALMEASVAACRRSSTAAFCALPVPFLQEEERHNPFGHKALLVTAMHPRGRRSTCNAPSVKHVSRRGHM